jgi:YD repeat-containing protein
MKYRLALLLFIIALAYKPPVSLAQSATITFPSCFFFENGKTAGVLQATATATINKAWATPTDPAIVHWSTDLFAACSLGTAFYAGGGQTVTIYGRQPFTFPFTGEPFPFWALTTPNLSIGFPPTGVGAEIHWPLTQSVNNQAVANDTATIFITSAQTTTAAELPIFMDPFRTASGFVGTITLFPGNQAPPSGFADPAGLGPAHQCTAACGEPIDATTGNTYVTAQDLSIPGLGGGIGLSRIWNSFLPLAGPPSAAGMFGDSWRSNYEELIQQPDASTLRYWRGDGSAWDFTFVAGTGYVLSKPSDEHAALVYDSGAGVVSITFKDGSVRRFDSAHNYSLTSITDRNGNATSLTYDISARLVQVLAPSGVILSFQYQNTAFPALVTSVTSPAGNVNYTYDSNRRLTSVAYADASGMTYAYDSNSLLTSVTDSVGHLIEGHTYDTFRRGLTSTRGNGADSINLEYLNGSTALITSRGAITTFNHSSGNGRRYVNSTSGPGCASCGAKSTATYSYDSSQNPVSVTDANGHVVNFSYDSQGNVLTRSAQLDDGTAQVWSYTYNQFSQVTSATDPLGNITSFQYDPRGNLLAVITPRPQ